MLCGSCNSRDMQNKNTPNLMFAQSSSFDDNTSIHANYTQFEQVSDRQFTALLMEVGKINSQIQVNNRNLIQMGKDMKKMGDDAVWFGDEITKLKSKPTGSGFTKVQIENIIDGFHGDDISRLDRIHGEQEFRLSEAKAHRDLIEIKIDDGIIEHQDFHSKFDNLGIALQESKTHRDSLESKIEGKSNKGHTHGNGGGGENDGCDIWDIPCKIKKSTDNMIQQMALFGALGLGGYLVLKKL